MRYGDRGNSLHDYSKGEFTEEAQNCGNDNQIHTGALIQQLQRRKDRDADDEDNPFGGSGKRLGNPKRGSLGTYNRLTGDVMGVSEEPPQRSEGELTAAERADLETSPAVNKGAASTDGFVRHGVAYTARGRVVVPDHLKGIYPRAMMMKMKKMTRPRS